jgi:hypothetical protein
MIHGTAPLVYVEPRYAWSYKHFSVVNYINTHGRLDASIDLYNNWPGFFALAAWFGNVAGVGTPLIYAAWAQLFFTLLVVLELGFALRALPLSDRERWLALFLFVGGDWVGQDYFSPQAMGFVLTLGVFAVALHWFGDDRGRTWLARLGHSLRDRLTKRRARIIDDERPALDVSRAGAIAVLLGVFSVLVVTHELSPYVVAIQMTALALIGRVRPRWIVVAMWALCLAYLLPRFALVDNTFHIVTALTNPFSNVQHSVKQYPPGSTGNGS